MILDDGDAQRRHRSGRRCGPEKTDDVSAWARLATDIFLVNFTILVTAPRNPSIVLPVAGFHRVS